MSPAVIRTDARIQLSGLAHPIRHGCIDTRASGRDPQALHIPVSDRRLMLPAHAWPDARPIFQERCIRLPLWPLACHNAVTTIRRIVRLGSLVIGPEWV